MCRRLSQSSVVSKPPVLYSAMPISNTVAKSKLYPASTNDALPKPSKVYSCALPPDYNTIQAGTAPPLLPPKQGIPSIQQPRPHQPNAHLKTSLPVKIPASCNEAGTKMADHFALSIANNAAEQKIIPLPPHVPLTSMLPHSLPLPQQRPPQQNGKRDLSCDVTVSF